MKAKCLLTILLALMIASIVSAIDCKRVITPKDVPCSIISSWSYTDCNSTQAFIFNSTPTLIATRNFTDYGGGRCNFTWNHSDIGSYIWNVSNADAGRIIVEYEDDTMASLAVTLFIMALTAIMFVLPFKVDFTRSLVANLILKRCCILFGMFLLSLDIVIIVTIADNFGLGVNSELFRYLWIVNWSIYLMMVWLVWSTIQDSIKLWTKVSKEKRMGDYD